MSRPPLPLEEAARRVVERLRQHGHEALWAGGCVRDRLLGLPCEDIDVATSAPPEEIIRLFTNTRQVGVKFGVVLVRQSRHWIETATFRTDLDYRDGRHPEQVRFTTAREDAQRRDFTINGLFYDPATDQIIDYVEGQRDLQGRIIRAIGEPAARFAEDHLRMLRAVRFATRFGFRVEPATAAAIREHAGAISRISPERIREEMEKMLVRPQRGAALKLMAESGLWPHLWPGADQVQKQWAIRMALVAALPAEADFVLAMAALLVHTGVPAVIAIGRDLRCSNEQIDHMRWLVTHARDLDAAATMSLATFKKLLAHPRWDDLMALNRARCLAEGQSLEACEIALARQATVAARDVAPPPLVTGEDLVGLGLQPGPAFKRILAELYDLQLDEQLLDRKAALDRLRAMIRPD